MICLAYTVLFCHYIFWLLKIYRVSLLPYHCQQQRYIRFYLLYIANRYCLYDDTEQSFSRSNIPNINNVHVFKVAFPWLPNKTRTNVCAIPKLTSTELDVLFIEHISSLLYQIYPREKFYVK